jgi:hypothetical protein
MDNVIIEVFPLLVGVTLTSDPHETLSDKDRPDQIENGDRRLGECFTVQVGTGQVGTGRDRSFHGLLNGVILSFV